MSKNKFGKVAVLMGGIGPEREISLMSGEAVLEALQQSGVDAHKVDVQQDIAEKLLQEKFDRAFVALHGADGEDGKIQGLLDIIGLPYTGSDVTASALSMDKRRAKWLWHGLGLPTPAFEVVHKDYDAEAMIAKFALPLAIKPNNQGSSLGITKVSNQSQLKKAVELAFTYDDCVLVEPWIEHKEITVGILAGEALPVISITTPEGFYDYEAKYFSEQTGFHIPSGLALSVEQQAQQLALRAYHALGCRHWGRVDMLQDKQGKLWLLEVNTIPGLTSHSLVPTAAKAIGIDFNALILRILEQTLDS